MSGHAPSKKVFRRAQREKLTVRYMVDIYCRAHHPGSAGTCAACQRLSEYATRKIDRCPRRAAKPVCSACLIHCYGREEREQIRAVMRFSGPRMLARHPVLAFLHLIDGLRPNVRVNPGRALS